MVGKGGIKLSFITTLFIENPISGKLVILGFLGFVILYAISHYTKKHKIAFVRRKAQSQNLLSENVIRAKLNQITTKKVKITTRMNVEKVCYQAGFNLTYDDFIIISIICGLLCSIFFQLILNNTFLAILFIVVGAFFPYQYFLFLRNKRLTILNEQIGPCINLLIERFEMSKDMKRSIEATLPDFQGVEPIYSELNRLAASINVGTSVVDAMHEFAERTGNKFLIRFADYYEMYSTTGTDEMFALLRHAYSQYQTDKSNRLFLKREISAVKSEGYLVLFGIPVIAIFQSLTDSDYVHFMTHTVVGQVGTSFVTIVFLISLWFLNKKVGAPIE